jgi:uncharacterized protein
LTDTARPLPVPDELSRAFWDGASAHRLVLARCDACQRLVHPPGTVCPFCGSGDAGFAFVPVDGSGRIRSWTTVRQSFLPGFVGPFVLVDVELAVQADLRLIGRLVDGPSAALCLDQAVQMVFEDVAPDVALPAFTLSERP